MGKKSGEIEVIREVKYFRIDTILIRKRSISSVYYYRYSVLSKNIIYASVLICFQHITTIIRVNPSKNNSTESQNLLAIPQITSTINSNSIPSQNTALCKINKAYLWPRSKGWMRALLREHSTCRD